MEIIMACCAFCHIQSKPVLREGTIQMTATKSKYQSQNIPNEEKYRLEQLQILIRSKNFRQAIDLIRICQKILRNRDPFEGEKQAQYYVYEWFRSVAQSFPTNDSQSLSISVMNAFIYTQKSLNAYKFYLAEVLTTNPLLAIQYLEMYHKNFDDNAYFLPSEAHLSLYRSRADQMNDCLIRIEKVLDGKPYREYKFFHYAHFMNEINLIRGIYEITPLYCSNEIWYKAFYAHKVIGEILYRKGEYQQAYNHFSVARKDTNNNFNKINSMILICLVQLSRIQQAKKYFYSCYRYQCQIKHVLLLIQIKIIFKMVDYEKQSLLKAVQKHRLTLDFQEKIQFAILKLIDKLLGKQGQNAIVLEAIEAVNMVNGEDVSPKRFYHYFRQLRFLVQYCYDRNKLKEGKWFAVKAREVIKNVERQAQVWPKISKRRLKCRPKSISQ